MTNLPEAILVTGATGTLGRPTVAALRAAGHEVRALSRHRGADRVVGNLLSGRGIAAALDGVHTVVNLATTGWRDVAMNRGLLAAAAAADVRHLVHLSIVGIDRVPLPYYRDKLKVERLIEASQIPYTILRASQFHNTLVAIFAAQRWSPVLLVPDIEVEPIDVRDVARRLSELTGVPASGRVPDIAGPERWTTQALADVWQRAAGSRTRVVRLRLPGKTFAAYAAGYHLLPGTPYGSITFEDYLAAQPDRP